MFDPVVPSLFAAAVGAGIFLRLVAKDKHRRERHLQFRLEEQIRKIDEERELAQQKAEKAKQGPLEEEAEVSQPAGTSAP